MVADKITRDEVQRVTLEVLARAYEVAAGAGGRAGEAGFCREDDIYEAVAGRGGTRGQIKYAVHGYEKRGLVEAVRAVATATKYRLTEKGYGVWEAKRGE